MANGSGPQNTVSAKARAQGPALVKKINELLQSHGVPATVERLHVKPTNAAENVGGCFFNDQGEWVCN